jgi:hypothetical protein
MELEQLPTARHAGSRPDVQPKKKKKKSKKAAAAAAAAAAANQADEPATEGVKEPAEEEDSEHEY